MSVAYIVNNKKNNHIKNPMGISLSTDDETTQDQSIQQLKQHYFISNNHILIHRATNTKCAIHCVRTMSKQQAQYVHSNVDKYQKSSCMSVMKLRNYYCSKRDGYCTNQKKYYFVFQGYSKPNIREEYLTRRHNNVEFSDFQVQSILCCMLCGLRQYYEYFNRKQSLLDLQSILIKQTEHGNMLIMKDPWLCQKHDTNSPTPINFYSKYPSPQKIDALNNQTLKLYDQLSSDLFSVGVYGLQLLSMNYRDDIYAPKKYIDFKIIHDHLKKVRNPRIRTGLTALLSDNIFQRHKIYELWSIHCSKKYYIKQIISQQYTRPRSQGKQQRRRIDQEHRGNLQPKIPIYPQNKQFFNQNREFHPKENNLYQQYNLHPIRKQYPKTVIMSPQKHKPSQPYLSHTADNSLSFGIPYHQSSYPIRIPQQNTFLTGSLMHDSNKMIYNNRQMPFITNKQQSFQSKNNRQYIYPYFKPSDR